MDIVRWLGQEPTNNVNVDPARIIDLTVDGAVAQLLDTYCGAWQKKGHNQRKVFMSVLTHATRCGAKTAVLERRYTDIDYRDEHARFYSRTFRQYPACTHRLHFFHDAIPVDVFSDEVIASFDSMTYLGYVVLRPVPGAVVGRTMLKVPDGLQKAVTCVARDTVSFFGKMYQVEAAPFMAQDSQLSSCAHVAAWMICYFHRLRYGTARVLPGDIIDAVPHALTIGRSVPTPGLKPEQLTDVLEKNGVPATVYWMDDTEMPPREVDKVARRYLDSGLPVIVGTRNPSHAYTLVGYSAEKRGKATFICQDDEVGPYQVRKRPVLHGSQGAWQYLIAPLPEQMYLTCEVAEQLGRGRFEHDLDEFASREPRSPRSKECRAVLDGLRSSPFQRGRFGFVTSAILSNEFKSSMVLRGYKEQVARSYMRLPMSKWIWVVELVNFADFQAGRQSVICEAVIDSTEHARDKHVLAWRLPGLIRHWDNDRDRVGDLEIGLQQPKAFSLCATSHPRGQEWR